MKRAVCSSALIALLIILAAGFKQPVQQVVAKERRESAGIAPPTTLPPAHRGEAAQATFKRTELQRGDLSIAGREAIQAIAEIPSGVASGRHTHPGEEVGYILEGTVVMEIEGQAPLTLKAGDVFLIPAGRIHNARNNSSETAKALSTYIIEKGKPLASRVP